MAGTYNSSFELQYAGAKVQSSLYPIFTSSKFTLQRWENRPRDSRVLIRLRTQQRNGNRVLQKMSVGQRALLVFIDWSFMPPPPQKQQLKFPKQEAMTKKDPELPCPLGCGMTCQGYTGTQYGNDRDQHTHIHNTHIQHAHTHQTHTHTHQTHTHTHTLEARKQTKTLARTRHARTRHSWDKYQTSTLQNLFK